MSAEHGSANLLVESESLAESEMAPARKAFRDAVKELGKEKISFSKLLDEHVARYAVISARVRLTRKLYESTLDMRRVQPEEIVLGSHSPSKKRSFTDVSQHHSNEHFGDGSSPPDNDDAFSRDVVLTAAAARSNPSLERAFESTAVKKKTMLPSAAVSSASASTGIVATYESSSAAAGVTPISFSGTTTNQSAVRATAAPTDSALNSAVALKTAAVNEDEEIDEDDEKWSMDMPLSIVGPTDSDNPEEHWKKLRANLREKNKTAPSFSFAAGSKQREVLGGAHTVHYCKGSYTYRYRKAKNVYVLAKSTPHNCQQYGRF